MTTKELKTPRYNKVNPFVIIKGGATKFIDFAEKVFDAEENKQVRTPDRDGTLIHAEIQIGDSMILLADSKGDCLLHLHFCKFMLTMHNKFSTKPKPKKQKLLQN